MWEKLIIVILLNLAPIVVVSFFCTNSTKKLIANSGETNADKRLNADASKK
jgi:hypothetical protein